MRLFVGVELDAPLRTSAAAAIALLRRAVEERAPDVQIRWLPIANLHLTLAFIGEVQDDMSRRVSASLSEGLAVSSFELSLAGAGAFPPSGPLRVVWIGVSDGESSLRRLQADIVARLSSLGLAFDDRAYSPHLTVARLKGARGPGARAVREALRGVGIQLGPQRVKAVTLFRSRVSSAGSTYDVLMRVPLQG
jgi:2'-5' RNA ligase